MASAAHAPKGEGMTGILGWIERSGNKLPDPVFLFFWLSHSPRHNIGGIFRAAVAAFLAVHALLHFSLSDTPGYTFQGLLSNTLIYGAALCGVAYLALQALRPSPDPT